MNLQAAQAAFHSAVKADPYNAGPERAVIVGCLTKPDLIAEAAPPTRDYTNTTYFVTDDEACDRFEFDAGRRRVDEIAVFSDGLEQLVLDLKARTAHDPFFNRMFPPLRWKPRGKGAAAGRCGSQAPEVFSRD